MCIVRFSYPGGQRICYQRNPSAPSLAGVQNQINATTQLASFAFPESLRLTIRANVESTHATVNNVLAYLPGKTSQYVILGAHYEHLGYGNHDSLAPSQMGQIHPGADDNASGTAGTTTSMPWET